MKMVVMNIDVCFATSTLSDSLIASPLEAFPVALLSLSTPTLGLMGCDTLLFLARSTLVQPR